MDTNHYLNKFQEIADQLDKKRFQENQLELKVGVWLESVALKIQKKSWINDAATAKPFQESVFFSIWINDELIQAEKISYNLHALKMRELKGYSIKSREFAEAFRSAFKSYEKDWPNISTDYGPLTLMEGWVKIDLNEFNNEVLRLAYDFLIVQHIIDGLLSERKKY